MRLIALYTLLNSSSSSSSSRVHRRDLQSCMEIRTLRPLLPHPPPVTVPHSLRQFDLAGTTRGHHLKFTKQQAYRRVNYRA